MELFKVLSKLKFKSYQLSVQFLISLFVPGILILFYFYREVFNRYDITRLIMIEIGISAAFLLASYFICSTLFISLELKYRRRESTDDDENESLEAIFASSAQFTFSVMLMLLLVFFLAEVKSFKAFLGWYVGILIAYGLVLYYILDAKLQVRLKEFEEQKERRKLREQDLDARRTEIKNELNVLRLRLTVTEAELDKVKQFHFLRTNAERQLQIAHVLQKQERTNQRINELNSELKQLGNG